MNYPQDAWEAIATIADRLGCGSEVQNADSLVAWVEALRKRAQAAEKEREDRIDLDVAKRTVMLQAKLAHAENAYYTTANEVENILGKALGYPWFKDDQKNFPGATEADGVCVGEHVPQTIAAQAANKIAALTKERDELLVLKSNAEIFIAGMQAGADSVCSERDALLAANRQFIKERDEMRAKLDGCLGQNFVLSENLKTLVPKWIPCSERMPEDDTQVLVWCENGHILVDWVDKDTGDFLHTPGPPSQASIAGYFATHWQPMLAGPLES
jgi:hypothetical protein